jgi:hypothetical protein
MVHTLEGTGIHSLSVLSSFPTTWLELEQAKFRMTETLAELLILNWIVP